MKIVGGIQTLAGQLRVGFVGGNDAVLGATAGLARDMTVELEGTWGTGGFNVTSWSPVSPDTPATDKDGNVYDGVRPGWTLITAGRFRQTTTLNGWAEIVEYAATVQPDPLDDPDVKQAYWEAAVATRNAAIAARTDAVAKTATWADPAATPMGATTGQAVGSAAAFRTEVINVPFVGEVPSPSPVVLLVAAALVVVLIVSR